MKKESPCSPPFQFEIFQNWIICFYKGIIKLAFNLAIIILIISLGIGIFKTIKDLTLVFTEPTVRASFKELVTNVLSLIVVLELIRAFVDYFEHEAVSIEILIEALIAFLIREFMIYLFEGKATGFEVFWWALGIVLVVFSRFIFVIYKGIRFFRKPMIKSSQE
ncbi:hypothetical protein F1847_03360 [Thermodesulfobacterium sp. TA1]|uniref:phosphate-starvation-inducible PsiE family protein n=1 Tax=Thermodesulfobacterium sp. TA1 TaxID=2234087 RepID=UPI001232B0E9|nr:phosphate-starvation-inducible PsiE family protein [Thermodesulfobacterium sp. TA1]QER41830.1 hypothetical protein F1847_03360 [Thermodesulfobacterium sp. TA1]